MTSKEKTGKAGKGGKVRNGTEKTREEDWQQPLNRTGKERK